MTPDAGAGYPRHRRRMRISNISVHGETYCHFGGLHGSGNMWVQIVPQREESADPSINIHMTERELIAFKNSVLGAYNAYVRQKNDAD